MWLFINHFGRILSRVCFFFDLNLGDNCVVDRCWLNSFQFLMLFHVCSIDNFQFDVLFWDSILNLRFDCLFNLCLGWCWCWRCSHILLDHCNIWLISLILYFCCIRLNVHCSVRSSVQWGAFSGVVLLMGLCGNLDIALSLDCWAFSIFLVFVQVLVDNVLDDLLALQELSFLLQFLSLGFCFALLFKLSFKFVISVQDILLIIHNSISVDSFFKPVVLVVTYVVGLGLIVVKVDRCFLVKFSNLCQINFSQEQSYHET